MNKLTIGTKVRIKGSKNWGGFHGKIIDAKPKKIFEVGISVFGKIFHVDFKLDELESM